jgi:hypothetical protein
LSDVTRLCLGLGLLALTGVLAGCSVNDPTETEFAPKIINDSGSTATIAYCNGGNSCKAHWWIETLAPGRRAEDSINAGHGNLSVFLVTDRGQRRCIRLAHYTKAIRLSEATRTACHPPYG